MSITVYGKPACPQCLATKSFLTTKGIDFKYEDVSKNSDAYSFVESLGYRSMPVVHVSENNTHWSGHDPDKLYSLELIS